MYTVTDVIKGEKTKKQKTNVCPVALTHEPTAKIKLRLDNDGLSESKISVCSFFVIFNLTIQNFRLNLHRKFNAVT